MPEFLPYSGAAASFPGVGQPATNKLVYPPRANIVVDDTIIGFIQQLDPSQSATVERIRHINFADAGRIIEQVTGPVDYTLTVRGFTLYTSTLLARLAGEASGKETEVNIVDESGGGIIPAMEWVSAKRPNIIVEFIHTGDTSITFRVIYGQCAFTSVGGTISLGDLYVTESVGLQPTYVHAESKVHVADEPMPLTS